MASIEQEVQSEVASTADTLGVDFYDKANTYWSGVPATVDGMLGGFSHLSDTDVSESREILREFFEGPNARTPPEIALDCGSGIGRVSKRLLLQVFKYVELVEQNPVFLKKSKSYLKPYKERVLDYHAVGLQDFHPQGDRYSLIWCQWVLSHLNDKDLVEFLIRCKPALKQGGLIMAKENVAKDQQERIFHADDSSETRSCKIFKELFQKAEFVLVKEDKQNNFPAGMLEVRTFVLGLNSS